VEIRYFCLAFPEDQEICSFIRSDIERRRTQVEVVGSGSVVGLLVVVKEDEDDGEEEEQASESEARESEGDEEQEETEAEGSKMRTQILFGVSVAYE